jgi:hypothetical protein
MIVASCLCLLACQRAGVEPKQRVQGAAVEKDSHTLSSAASADVEQSSSSARPVRVWLEIRGQFSGKAGRQGNFINAPLRLDAELEDTLPNVETLLLIDPVKEDIFREVLLHRSYSIEQVELPALAEPNASEERLRLVLSIGFFDELGALAPGNVVELELRTIDERPPLRSRSSFAILGSTVEAAREELRQGFDEALSTAWAGLERRRAERAAAPPLELMLVVDTQGLDTEQADWVHAALLPCLFGETMLWEGTRTNEKGSLRLYDRTDSDLLSVATRLAEDFAFRGGAAGKRSCSSWAGPLADQSLRAELEAGTATGASPTLRLWWEGVTAQ